MQLEVIAHVGEDTDLREDIRGSVFDVLNLICLDYAVGKINLKFRKNYKLEI